MWEQVVLPLAGQELKEGAAPATPYGAWAGGGRAAGRGNKVWFQGQAGTRVVVVQWGLQVQIQRSLIVLVTPSSMFYPFVADRQSKQS